MVCLGFFMNLILMRIDLCFEVAARLKVDERVHG
jgi:hypothetical protein